MTKKLCADASEKANSLCGCVVGTPGRECLSFLIPLWKTTHWSLRGSRSRVISPATRAPGLVLESQIQQAMSLPLRADIDIAFQITSRLWLTLSWVDHTRGTVGWLRPDELLWVTAGSHLGQLDTHYG